MTFNDYLKKMLPIITGGLTVANPLLGGIASLASSIGSIFGLGSDAKVDDIVEILKKNSFNPEHFIKLQELESTLKLKQIEAQQEVNRTQSELTKLDMQDHSIFRNGCHASCCWLCVTCLIYHYIIRNF
jgi:hypothetical protein